MQPTKSATERVTGEFAGVVGDFYTPWLTRAEQELRCRLDAEVVAVADVINDVLTSLMQCLVRVGARTIVTAVQESPPHDDFSTASARISSPRGREEILARYPVLGRLLEQLTEQTVSATVEAVTRYRDDRTLIADSQLTGGSRIVGIDPSAGDSHAGGRRVLILRTDVGRLVYKPRPLDIDVLVIRLAGIVSDDLGPRRVSLPATLARGPYGWQEFIEARPARDEAEYREYYRNLGSALAFFTALGGHDLHYENIIGVGSAPVAVDLETALRVRGRMPRGDTLVDAVSRESWYGPGGTMILPNMGNRKRFDVDLSVAGTEVEQHSKVMTSGRLMGAGTRDIRMEQVPAVIRRTPHASADLDSTLTFPDLSADVREGYAQAATVIRRHLPALREHVRHVHGEMRDILRPTSTYAAFLEAATHPRYLTDDAERTRLFSLLGEPASVPDDVAKRVYVEELAALERGDIPFFWYRPESGELREACGSAFALSPENTGLAAMEALDAFAERALEKDLHLIEGLAATVSTDLWRRRRPPSPRSSLFQFPTRSNGEVTPSSAGFALADQMLELAVFTPDRSQATWITPLLGEGNAQLELAPADLTLYQGSGPAILLAAASAATNDPRYREALHAVVDPLLVALEAEIPSSTSAYTGAASVWRTLAAVNEVLRAPRISAAQDIALAMVHSRLGTDAVPQDTIGGAAGVIPVLVAADGGTGRYAEDIAHAVDITRAWDPPLSAEKLAHGRLGALVGIATAAEILDLDVERIADDILAEVRAALAQPVTAPGATSWCKGASGALIGALEVFPLLGITHSELEGEVGGAVRDWFSLVRPGADASLCHGNAGLIVAAAHAGRAFADETLTAWARSTAEHVVVTGARDGYNGGIEHAQNSLGYYLGMPGFAHSLIDVEHQLPGHLSPLTFGLKTPVGSTV